MKLGIFGGTFNPIHVGHLAVARAVRRSLALDLVLFVPAGKPPHKDADLAPAEDRLEMTQRALRGEEEMAVSDLEVRREGTSYTVDTLESLARQHPEAELYFLIGADSLPELQSWYRLPRILELVQLVVVNRPGHEEGAGDVEPVGAAHDCGTDLLRVHIEPCDVSSSEIRQACRRGELPGDALPTVVADYIRERGLYGFSAGGGSAVL